MPRSVGAAAYFITRGVLDTSFIESLAIISSNRSDCLKAETFSSGLWAWRPMRPTSAAAHQLDAVYVARGNRRRDYPAGDLRYGMRSHLQRAGSDLAPVDSPRRSSRLRAGTSSCQGAAA
jgi:hypothetical protein